MKMVVRSGAFWRQARGIKRYFSSKGKWEARAHFAPKGAMTKVFRVIPILLTFLVLQR